MNKKLLIFVVLLVAFAGSACAQSADEMNRLRIAQALEQAGEFDKALDFYKQLYNFNPTNIVYFDGLRRAYMNLKEYGSAEELIRSRLTTDPSNVGLYCQLGDVYFKEGTLDSAMITWNKAIEVDPKNPGIYQAVADVMTQDRLFDKAIEVYKKGEAITSSKSGFIIQIARLYFFNMNYRESLRELLRLFQSDNKSAAIAYIESQLGSYSSSKEAVDEFTVEMKSQVDGDKENFYYRHLLAFLYMEQKNYQAAYDVYKWLDEHSDAKGIELLSFAERAYNDEAFQEAADAYEEVSRLSKARPVIAQSLMGYANSLRRLGESDFSEDDRPCAASDTLTTLNAALAAYGEIISEFFGTQYLSAAVLNSINIEMNYFRDFNGAERLFAEHGNFSPEYTRQATLARIDLRIMEGKFNDALAQSLAHLGADTAQNQTVGPDNNYLDRLRYDAASALYFIGNYDSASFYLDKIVSNPMSDAANEAIQLLNVISNNKAVPDALKQYASAGAMEVCGRVPEAASELEEIVKTFPQIPLADNARFDLAADYCRMGKIDRALKTYSSIAADSTGIFADRAQFRIARIYQTTLHDTSSAIREYESFLARFPHSIYQDKVRGMLRNLLGNNS